jgi:sec-independent protein translocase protein TatB
VFNLGVGELTLILVVALLVLGPKRLPELARGLGKFIREFRKQTDEVRTVVEREFYKMDQELEALPPPTETNAPPVASPSPSPEPEPDKEGHG